MLDKGLRARIISLVHREVVPAMGCTEPMSVALCTAKATEKLGCRPERIEALLSANILKNAMGVGIPGTGMTGLPIAIALGALIGKSDYQLEVLKDLDAEALQAGRQYVAENRITIKQKENNTEKLYVEVTCSAGNKQATAIIAGSHTRFVDNPISPENSQAAGMPAACDTSCEEHVALRLLISRTASACDARMGGAMIPVMSNSGSGNQGICATNPVCVYAKENENTEEELTRALMLSHLTAIYIKQSLGKLSALCGCVVASIGSSCGITYLMGGDYERICYSVKNMIANLTGMICDGAKPSCSLKITSGVSTALLSALLAMEGKCVSSSEGIVDDDVDKSIHNLTSIGADAMCKTDDMVLSIMTSKHC